MFIKQERIDGFFTNNYWSWPRSFSAISTSPAKQKREMAVVPPSQREANIDVTS
jgi:hypothetical protein